MTGERTSETQAIRISAALDGELDSVEMASFERELAADPDLAASYDRMKALRAALRAHAQTFDLSEAARARILNMASGARDAPPSPLKRPQFPRLQSQIAWAAALALAVFAGALGRGALTNDAFGFNGRVAMTLVDDHRRSLLAREPIDVASSDRHTVKPWFDSRLALSPPVVDLSAKNYALVGGRADVVDGAPVPVIVYRLREHYVSLTALPKAHFAASSALASIDGYEVLSWSDESFVFYAVSDMPLSDLEAFAAAYRSGAGAPEGAR